MLDPDQDEMNADPQPWCKATCTAQQIMRKCRYNDPA
jgi:hypothetical protein